MVRKRLAGDGALGPYGGCDTPSMLWYFQRGRVAMCTEMVAFFDGDHHPMNGRTFSNPLKIRSTRHFMLGQAPARDLETELHEACSKYYADPLGFVLGLYPWPINGSERPLQGSRCWNPIAHPG